MLQILTKMFRKCYKFVRKAWAGSPSATKSARYLPLVGSWANTSLYSHFFFKRIHTAIRFGAWRVGSIRLFSMYTAIRFRVWRVGYTRLFFQRFLRDYDGKLCTRLLGLGPGGWGIYAYFPCLRLLGFGPGGWGIYA